MNNGWTSATLQELTTKIGSGATPKGGKKSYKSHGISLVRSLNVHDRYFKTKDLAFIDEQQAALLDNVVLEEADVLLNITGASIARCCVMPSDYLPARVNQHVSIVRADNSIILPTFLCYLLTSKQYKDRLLSTGEKQGSTRQALTKSLVQGFRISFPEDLSEQQRIVAILDEAFAAIDQARSNTENNLENARELFESYLNRVFTETNEDWVEKKLSELCFTGRVITYGVIKLGDVVPEGVPCLRTSNVKKLRFELSGVKRIAKSLSESYGRTILQGGELLVNVRGTLGGVAVVPPDMAGWNVSREVAVAPIDPSIVDPTYASFYVASKEQQDWLTGVKKGAAYTGINIADLRKLPIKFPEVHEEQKAIVQTLETAMLSARRLEGIYTKKLIALDELKQSLLEKAFTGDLTSKAVEQEMANA